VYGLQAAPCKPCPRNMITDGLSKVNSSDACVNPAGFGYASEGASRCAVGFFAGKGSRRPCAGCPQGRTTLDKPLAQASLRDCFVKPGFGVANASLGGDAFNMDTSGMGPDQLVALPVLECPVGSYGPGNASAAKCAACPAGSSTEGPGASSLTSCSGECHLQPCWVLCVALAPCHS
jgi:hypothetical protein